MSVVEESKRRAAYAAVDKHILPNHKIIGIGSGSTVPYVVERIVHQGAELNKERVFIPTGFQSKQLIIEANLNLGDVDQFLSIDVTIDGADEVDPQLNCIKGGGACQLREKVLAEVAKTFVLVADYRKKQRVSWQKFHTGRTDRGRPFCVCQGLAGPAQFPRLTQCVTSNGKSESRTSRHRQWELCHRRAIFEGLDKGALQAAGTHQVTDGRSRGWFILQCRSSGIFW